MKKKVIKDVKARITRVAMEHPSEREVVRRLYKMFYDTIGLRSIGYETYAEVTAHFVILASLWLCH